MLLSIVIVIPLGIFSIVPIVALTNWSPLYTKTLQVVKLAKALEISPGKTCASFVNTTVYASKGFFALLIENLFVYDTPS